MYFIWGGAEAAASGSVGMINGHQVMVLTFNSSISAIYHVTTACGVLLLMQDVLQPRLERLVNRQSLNSCAWLGPPHVVVTGGADGQIRQTWLDAGVQATNTPTVTADGEPGRRLCTMCLR
jgi:hypothetical protein